MERKLSLKERFEREIARLRDDPAFQLDQLLLDLNAGMWAAMQSRDVSRSELAERLGTSRAYVTKLLDGHENMTLKTLVRVANAMEMTVDVRLTPRKAAAVVPATGVKTAVGTRMRYAPPPIASGKKATVKTAAGRGMHAASTAKRAATARTASRGRK